MDLQIKNLGPEEEQLWLRRFLLGELDAAQADAFETYALDKPRLLDQMEADLLLRRGLGAMAAQGESVMMEALPPASAKRGPVPAWPWLGMAACLAAGWIGARMLGPAMPLPLQVASPERLVFETVRGERGQRSLEASAAASQSPIVVVDVVLPPLATLASARLSGPRGEIPLADARPDRDGVLTVVLDRAALPGAELVLALRDAEGTHEQRLRLDPPPAAAN